MSDFRIVRLDLHEIGPFGDISLTFPEKTIPGKAEIHILTGENGTGKSTVLEMLIAGIGQTSKSHHQMFISPEFFTKSRKEESSLVIYCQRLIEYLNANPSKKIESRLISKNVVTNLNFIRDYWGNIFEGSEVFSIAFFAYSGYRRVIDVKIEGIKEVDNHPLESSLDLYQSGNPNEILQWLANNIAAEAIATSQGETTEAAQRREAVQRVEKAISNITGKTVAFKLETKPYAVKIEVDGERLDFNNLPDGLKSIIAWIADLLMRMDRVKWVNDIPVLERNFVLFLDEIEVHLHPAWQRKILPAVQTLFPSAQIFISTHSPFVIGSVDGAWIHKLEKPNGNSHLAAGYPKLSEDAKSYRYWLDEVFDIKGEFGPDIETKFSEFYALRDALLQKDNDQTRKALRGVANELLDQKSQEVESIVGFEIRQINKRIQEPIDL